MGKMPQCKHIRVGDFCRSQGFIFPPLVFIIHHTFHPSQQNPPPLQRPHPSTSSSTYANQENPKLPSRPETILTSNVKPKLPIKIPEGLWNTSRMFGDPLFRLAGPSQGIKKASSEDDKRATSYMQSGQDSGRIANSVSSTVYSTMHVVEWKVNNGQGTCGNISGSRFDDGFIKSAVLTLGNADNQTTTNEIWSL